ncbi:MAG: hypothetical protein H6797_00745 [Candidatus Nomurabacteria bacterium]|nr:MAG: hypothetical protein H6797_00745 [Candidatus Nomurabacteria bacterium]
MELIEKYRWPVFFGTAVILLGVLIGASNSGTKSSDTSKKSPKVSTSQQKKAEQMKKEEAVKAKAEAAKSGTVTYTARMGDSYTVLARKAVQAYASDTGVTLEPAQIVAAETHLTVDAHSPYLNYGQKVTLDKATVAKAVASAQALTAAQLAAWQVYVPYVSFDTSQNG